GSCEFMGDVAAQVPVGVFMHLANLPAQDAFALPRYGEDALRADGSIVEPSIMDRFADYLRPHVAARKKHPGDDLISGLVTTSTDGRCLTEDEAVEVATAVLTGGLDTVVSSLGLMMAFLARNPMHRRRLVCEPTMVRPAVAE